MVYEMESNLYESRVIIPEIPTTSTEGETPTYANKSLLQLESTLLELSSHPKLCQGIMYMFPVNCARQAHCQVINICLQPILLYYFYFYYYYYYYY